jgi:hypothetical protein
LEVKNDLGATQLCWRAERAVAGETNTGVPPGTERTIACDASAVPMRLACLPERQKCASNRIDGAETRVPVRSGELLNLLWMYW